MNVVYKDDAKVSVEAAIALYKESTSDRQRYVMTQQTGTQYYDASQQSKSSAKFKIKDILGSNLSSSDGRITVL